MWMVLAGLIGLALQSGGAAATRCVSADGSDENAGTKEEPWATLQQAVDAAKPGDTILVGPGFYAGCVIRRSGTAEAPIVLKAEGPGVHVDRPGSENRRRSCIEVGTHRELISQWVVDGFEVSGARRWGINVGRTEHVTVQNCRVHDCGLTGIFTAFSDHVTIQFNESYDNDEHGIYHSNSGDYPVIRGNRSHHNAGCGIHMNGDRNMGGDGLISHGLVERNIIWENGRAGGSAINCDGVSDSVIRNNLCYRNYASGISLYAIDAAEGSSRNEVYHNTVVMGPEGRWVLNIPWWQRRPAPVGNRVANNIFYTSNPETGAILIWGEKALAGSDHNLVVGRFATDAAIPEDAEVAHLGLEEGAALRPAEGGRTRLDLRGWQQLGWGAHSLEAGPEELFVNAAEDDYRLREGSPANGAGRALPGVTEDLRGRPRDKARADVGCYDAEEEQS
jgi:parallel beta-helix repeat protein